MLGFVFAPVDFFERRLRREPDWIAAWSAPLLCAALHLAGALIVGAKVQPVLDSFTTGLGVPAGIVPVGQVLAFFSVAGYPIAYGAAVLAIVAFDVLLGGSSRPARLAEFVGLCFYTHVPYTAFVVVAAWLWEPEAPRWPSGATGAEAIVVVERFRESIVDAPLFVTARLLSQYAALWLVCLLGVVLKVVSGVSPGTAAGAVALGISLLLAVKLIGSLLLPLA